MYTSPGPKHLCLPEPLSQVVQGVPRVDVHRDGLIPPLPLVQCEATDE